MLARHRLVALLVLFAIGVPMRADRGRTEFNAGAQEEQKGDYDSAFGYYKQAYTLAPDNPKYLAAYTRTRFTAATQHVHNGNLLRNAGALKQALAEFQQAAAIDSSSSIAQQEAQHTTELLASEERQKTQPKSVGPPVAKFPEDFARPVELQPLSNAPITMYLTENADIAYKTLGKLAGINVLVDPDYRPQKITIDLTNVTLREALDMVRLQSKTYWRAVLPNTIFVTADSPAKRKDLEQNVMRTFYLRNIETPNELQEAANVVRQMLDVSRVQLLQAQDALVLRGTPDQMILAEKLLTDFDRPRSEVIIDIAVMEVSRDKIRTIGNNLSTSFNVGILPPSNSSSTNGSSSSGSSSSGSIALNAITKIGTGNLLVSLPSASVSLLASDSNTKILQNPQIRALNNEKATLRIGDRVPIATGSFSPGIVGGGSVSPLVSTQFQYIDVGVNIDITPHIHSDLDVTLKMSLEISSIANTETIGGITQPVIGQRRIEHEARLRDGEVNLLGGILEDTETHSMSGYPWISKVPILKYLFAQDNKERQQNEIVFVITPHIVRAPGILNENQLQAVDVGNGTSIELHRKPLAAVLTAPDQSAAIPVNAKPPVPEPAGAVPSNANPAVLIPTRPGLPSSK